jgi:hypothetical protein
MVIYSATPNGFGVGDNGKRLCDGVNAMSGVAWGKGSRPSKSRRILHNCHAAGACSMFV